MNLAGFNVKFEYTTEWSGIAQKDVKVTTCTITREGSNIHYTGKAIPSGKDNFCRDTGRKIALKRAVQSLPKKDRSAIWGDYRNSTEVPRW